MTADSGYLHCDHAANRSDLVKHLCLLVLGEMSEYPTIWDAFAAAPVTPLADMSSPRRELISKLLQCQGPAPVTELQARMSGCRMPTGEPCYPGSSAILSEFTGLKRLIVSDHDANCATALNHYFRNRSVNVEARQIDSYRQATEILQQRPGLIFIDPPYLGQEEWRAVMDLYEDIQDFSPDSGVVLWYPLRKDLVPLLELQSMPRIQLTVHYHDARRLLGCAMVFLHFSPVLLEYLQPLVEWLRTGPLGIVGVELDS